MVACGHVHVRPESFRDEADCREFYNIDRKASRKVQIQSLIVSILAYKTPINIGH